jgi:hypothetical protein
MDDSRMNTLAIWHHSPHMIRKDSRLLPRKQTNCECLRHCNHGDRSDASRRCNTVLLRRIGWHAVDCIEERNSRRPDQLTTREASDYSDSRSDTICALNHDRSSRSIMFAVTSMIWESTRGILIHSLCTKQLHCFDRQENSWISHILHHRLDSD